MIGVLAIVALLAAALVPVLIRKMDRMAGEQESAALRSFGDALQQSVMRLRYIPGTADWATNIASEVGLNVSNVRTNGRQQPRFFLMDPAWQIGSATNQGQSYLQTTAGTSQATNLRAMIISSVGERLTTMTTGVPTAADFNAIWDWNDGSSAPPSAYVLGGLTKGEDLKVQRVNLSSLFVRLLLTTNSSVSKAFCSIDQTNSPVQVTNTVDRYFLRNSILFLYAAGQTSVPDSQRILDRDTSFVYDQDAWRDSIGGRTGGSTSVAGLDFGSIVEQYLKAPENTNAFFTLTNNGHGNTNISVTQQSVVVSNMIAYFKAYDSWVNAGYPYKSGNKNDPVYQAALDAQAAMLSAAQGQYQNGGSSKDYSPRPYTDSRCP